jgi:hypothetical protein
MKGLNISRNPDMMDEEKGSLNKKALISAPLSLITVPKRNIDPEIRVDLKVHLR